MKSATGSSWIAITGGVSGGGLVLTPNVSTGMNVTGGCGSASCTGTNVTFTLTNNLSPAASSVVLSTSLSNTLNFEIISDGCNGSSLAAGAACQIVVRPKASGNVAYAATLSIIGNNSPFAMLDGTAGGFIGCNPGGQGGGGIYAACGVGGYDLVVTPGGCTSTTLNPTCGGGTDSTNSNHTSDYIRLLGAMRDGNGVQNTVDMVAYGWGGNIDSAAIWCSSLDYNGFTDWFLPSMIEMRDQIAPVRTLIGGWDASANYLTSTGTGNVNQAWVGIVGATGAIQNYISTGRIRCARRDNIALPAPTGDTTPDPVIFTTSYGGPSEARTSNAITIQRVTQPVAISVSGSGSPQYSKNGGAYTSAAGTVTNGDQITLQATSPAAGIEQTVTLTLGSLSPTWRVRTIANNTIRVFTRSAVINGNFGSVGAADSACTASANLAGLGGNWVAVTTLGVISVRDRLPWNWTELRNMNGALVATSLDDFMDGSVTAPMNFSETGAPAATGRVWTGLNTSGMGTTSKGGHSESGNCWYWTVGSGGRGVYGDSSVTSGGGYFSSSESSCNDGITSLLCMSTGP